MHKRSKIYNNISKILIMCFTTAISGLLVWLPTLKIFFVYEDFEHLFAGCFVNANHFLFGSAPNFFRPLSTFWFWTISRSLFGLNPVGYHAVNILCHIAASGLVFWSAELITQKKFYSFLISIFYCIHLSHFYNLSWISGFELICMTFFYFLSFGLYLAYNLKKNSFLYICSLIAYILALFSKELAVTLPINLLLYHVIIHPVNKMPIENSMTNVKRLFPYFFITALYLSIWLYFIGVPQSGPYRITFGSHIFENFIKYLGWSLGLLFVNPFNTSPLLTFPDIILPKTASLLAFVCLCCLAYALRKQRILFYFVMWIPIGLIPVIFLPEYSHAHFVSISLFGVLGIIVTGISKLIGEKDWSKGKLCVGLVGVILLAITATSAILIRSHIKTSWLPIHARFAEQVILFVRGKQIDLPVKTRLYILNFSRGISEELALKYGKAIRVFYDERGSIDTVFLKGVDAVNFLYSYRREREGEKEIVLKVFPKQWLAEGFNGGSGEVGTRCIELHTSSLRRRSGARAKFESGLLDNFELRVDFNLISFRRPSRGRVEADVTVEIEGDLYSIGRWNDAKGLDAYWMWGGGVSNTYVPTKDASGKLRVRRVGSTLYGDYWDSGKWVNIGSRPIKNGTAYVSLSVFNSTSRKKVEVQFSNFRVISGETLFSKYYCTQDSVILE